MAQLVHEGDNVAKSLCWVLGVSNNGQAWCKGGLFEGSHAKPGYTSQPVGLTPFLFHWNLGSVGVTGVATTAASSDRQGWRLEAARLRTFTPVDETAITASLLTIPVLADSPYTPRMRLKVCKTAQPNNSSTAPCIRRRNESACIGGMEVDNGGKMGDALNEKTTSGEDNHPLHGSYLRVAKVLSCGPASLRTGGISGLAIWDVPLVKVNCAK